MPAFFQPKENNNNNKKNNISITVMRNFHFQVLLVRMAWLLLSRLGCTVASLCRAAKAIRLASCLSSIHHGCHAVRDQALLT